MRHSICVIVYHIENHKNRYIWTIQGLCSNAWSLFFYKKAKEGGVMPREPNEKVKEAYRLYQSGMKLIEVAEKLDVPAGTVRRWKSTYHWDSEEKSERSDKGKANVRIEKTDQKQEKSSAFGEAERVSQNTELTEKQRLFCLYYVKYRNKVRAYQKAFDCSYANACGHASALWKKVEIQKEINRLLEEYRTDVGLEIKDLFQWYLDIARADMNDFVKMNGMEVQVKEQIDGTLVSEISETANGIKIKLNDRMKAMEWLDGHIGMAEEEQKARIEALKAKAETESKSAAVDDWVASVFMEGETEDG